MCVAGQPPVLRGPQIDGNHPDCRQNEGHVSLYQGNQTDPHSTCCGSLIETHVVWNMHVFLFFCSFITRKESKQYPTLCF